MLKTITINQVRIGMYIHELKGPWMEHPFWRTKFVLKDEADLLKLKGSALKQVVIDIKRGLDVLPEPAPVQPVKDEAVLLEENLALEQAAQQVRQVPLDVEHRQAAKIIQSSRRQIMSMFKDLRMGKVIEAEDVMPLVDEISASVNRNTHALISLVRLKTADDYTYLHSIAVSALMTSLAKELKLSETEVKQAGLAGLMHDMGKAEVPLKILNKPGSLTDNEFSVIRQHPQNGYDLLMRANITDPVTLDVCLHHHEKMDGSGYPGHLSGDDISIYAKMGAVCDVYDAITSARAYKPAWEPGIALKRMASWNGHFDPVVLEAFIKSMGIYPIGTLVMLKSGRLAVVVRQSTESLLKPVVKAFFSTKSLVHIPVEEMDLSKRGADEIISNESAVSWGIGNIEHLWATH
ncbi:MAG TPA: HD-GYP domain-containing protein [Methylophilus sp.]|uniref:HD-GYP domain-containing protein n=1 Tax=Methylophilus sp. TaxID=29541 RepID=UPI002CE61585|nr:HD-GYP domain-containing protein [Methylophilus sp.]HSH85849.1 HD-GYP domain-containing protein [Methylophilus sp.]